MPFSDYKSQRRDVREKKRRKEDEKLGENLRKKKPRRQRTGRNMKKKPRVG